MADIYIQQLVGERTVVHFGGEPSGINSYTFGQSLLGLTATALAVNHVINPGENIEIVLEADGSGSFRAVLRRVSKGPIKGFFSDGAKQILWGVVATIVYENVIKTDPKPSVVVNSTEVVMQCGGDRIIVPRQVHDAAQHAEKSADVQRGISRTFTPLEANPAVTDFGLTGSLSDPRPLIQIPRSDFPVLAQRTAVVDITPLKTRQHTETARVLILKAWVNHKKRKWSFEWNGVPVSAPIVDDEFLNKIDRREYLIGSGDALDVEITVTQDFNEKLGVYVNDQRSYLITRVIDVIPKQ